MCGVHEWVRLCAGLGNGHSVMPGQGSNCGWRAVGFRPDRCDVSSLPFQDWSNRRAERDKSKQVMVSRAKPT